jgi:NAD(P)H-flavin reductase
MGTLEVGDEFATFAGPLGHPTEIEAYGTVVCVGGGVGIAPIYPIARALKEAGNTVISIIGARNQGLLFWEDKMQAASDELIVCTDDGSHGIKGLVTAGLEKAIAEHSDIDQVLAIGPPIMMKACAETTRPHGIKTVVSLNPIMVDGTGMCGGCRVSVEGKMKFGCVDGPDFDAHKVDFDELLMRLSRFVPKEKESLEKWRKECRIQQQAGQLIDQQTKH